MSFIRPLLALTVALTGVELYAVAHARLGMQWMDLLLWCMAAHLLYAAFTLGLWQMASRILNRRHALSVAMGTLLALHLGLTYRMDFAVNLFMKDIRVWGVSIVIFLLSLAIGFGLSKWLRTAEKWLWGIGALVTILLPFKGIEAVSESNVSLPDIVLISLDTTRPDALGAYGGQNQTPNIDALAERAVRFTQAISTAPLTEPAHLSMLTGQDTLQTSVVSNGTQLGEQPAFVTHILRAQGYQTAAFVSGFPLHARYGWADYFDVYDDDFGDWMGLHRLHIVQAWDQVVLPAHTLRERRGDTAVDRAHRWLLRHENQPKFLWLHLFDPHAPYEAPNHPFDPPTDGDKLELPAYWPPPHRAITDAQWLIEAYHAEVRYVDSLLGPLLDSISDNSIVILTADHGESLTEHGYFFEHGDNLFDPSLRIPLLVSAPSLEPQVNDCLVSSMDIPNTILSLLELDDGVTRSGRPLQAILAAAECPERIQLSTTIAARFVDQPPLSISARTPANKLIKTLDSADCYHLQNDPDERLPQSATACPTQLNVAIELAEQGGEAKAPQLDAQTQDALEALGYIE